MIRYRKTDVLKDLPDVTVNNYAIDLDQDERDLYGVFKKKLQGHYEALKRKGPDGPGTRESGELLAATCLLEGDLRPHQLSQQHPQEKQQTRRAAPDHK